jgi:hypothetical protein
MAAISKLRVQRRFAADRVRRYKPPRSDTRRWTVACERNDLRAPATMTGSDPEAWERLGKLGRGTNAPNAPLAGTPICDDHRTSNLALGPCICYNPRRGGGDSGRINLAVPAAPTYLPTIAVTVLLRSMDHGMIPFAYDPRQQDPGWGGPADGCSPAVVLVSIAAAHTTRRAACDEP